VNPQPKIRTPRDSKYLAWLRTQPCVVCLNPVTGQSHHTESGGISLVGSDYSAVPICSLHHREIHQHSSKRGKWGEEELAGIIERLLAAYDLIKK